MNVMRREGLTGLWAIRKHEIREIAHNIKALTGQILSSEDIRLKAEASFQAQMDDPRIALVGSVAVLQICGPIFNRGNLYSYFFGGAVISVLRAQLRKALADDDVKAILLRVDSPGGVTDGVTEFAAELLKARTVKPIVAIADTCMASAAYWLAASAEEVVASPSAFVGSVGVFYEHDAITKALEIAGVEVQLVASSEEKVEDHESKVLTDDALAHKQDLVDTMAAMFKADVAKGRGVTPKVVASDYGNGRTFLAKEAQRRGLVDRVATFEETVARLTGGGRRRGLSAEEPVPELVAAGEEPVVDAVDLEPVAAEAEASAAEEPSVARAASADLDWARGVLARVSRQVDDHVAVD